jgi:hypothetical protein
MNCPFKVGDIIHEIRAIPCITVAKDRSRTVSFRRELDEFRPDAVVTAITERGFTYEYDYPVPIGRAEWGEMMVGGECYEAGFSMWRKIER